MGKTHLLLTRLLRFLRPLLGLRVLLALETGRFLEFHHYVPSVKLLGEWTLELCGVDLLQAFLLLVFIRWLLLAFLKPGPVLPVRSFTRRVTLAWP